MTTEIKQNFEQATLGAGCFWCTEAAFQQIKGIESVIPGYTGGNTQNPSYEEVCSGTTGHAEVARIIFDPKVISFRDILEIFWTVHDPTTLNRQGADVGTQYRSAIFYHNEHQKNLATSYKKELDQSGIFEDPIVTEISPLTEFYEAEDYHKNYYNQNPNQPYCSFVVKPKIEKVKKVFRDQLKES